jgi:hypothetical protein
MGAKRPTSPGPQETFAEYAWLNFPQGINSDAAKISNWVTVGLFPAVCVIPLGLFIGRKLLDFDNSTTAFLRVGSPSPDYEQIESNCHLTATGQCAHRGGIGFVFRQKFAGSSEVATAMSRV